MTEHHDTIKDILDIAAIFSTIGAFLEWVSPVFGLIGAVVGLMRIVEMATGKPFADVFKRGSDASNKP
jgi:NADH:ubiquinone oxidoreductase subunit 6 (subunit J)